MINDHNLLLIGGAGKIGTAIVEGLAGSGTIAPERIGVTARHHETLEAFPVEGVQTFTDNPTAFEEMDRPIVILSVHPDEVTDALEQLCESEEFEHCPLLISVATGVPTGQIESLIPAEIPVVRSMPNLPARIQSGVTSICAGAATGRIHMDAAEEIFRSIGGVVRLDEQHMEGVTGLSGCGPAFTFQIIEAMAHGGVQVGLPREEALTLAATTLKGAAEMVIETGDHPAVLKDAVTTPGGCTVAALSRMEELGLEHAMIEAVEIATKRAGELYDEPLLE